MPKYRAKSGIMNRTVEVPYSATPKMIAVMAIMQDLNFDLQFGVIIEITGGEYVAGEVSYVSTERLLEEMGMMEK